MQSIRRGKLTQPTTKPCNRYLDHITNGLNTPFTPFTEQAHKTCSCNSSQARATWEARPHTGSSHNDSANIASHTTASVSIWSMGRGWHETALNRDVPEKRGPTWAHHTGAPQLWPAGSPAQPQPPRCGSLWPGMSHLGPGMSHPLTGPGRCQLSPGVELHPKSPKGLAWSAHSPGLRVLFISIFISWQAHKAGMLSEHPRAGGLCTNMPHE